MEYKKSIWKWIILYGVIGLIAYGGIYYFFFYQKQDYSYNNQQTDQANSQTKAATINETSDWKTYTSDNRYFSVQWFPNWKIENNGNYGIILSGREGSFNIAWNGLGGACDEDKIKQFTAGEDFYWICDQKADGLYYSATISKISNSDIAIGIIPTYSGTTDADKAIFIKVLKSIKLNFISQILAVAKTYRNDEYGFEFKYLANELCPGQEGSDVQGNVSLVDLCPSSTSGNINISVKNNVITNGVLQDAYFRGLDKPTITTVGGKTAYQYSINQDGCKGYLTAIPVPTNKTLEIVLDNCGAGQVDDPKFPNNGVPFMNQLLSTFKFIK